jgi:hypothetical protein
MKTRRTIRNLAVTMTMLLLARAAGWAQTATGVINGTLINKSGISLVFDSDPAGVPLGASGTSAASLNFGNIFAFGTGLAAGVTRPSVTAANFTVQTVFDVNVTQGGGNSASYTLTANLAAAAPTGFSYVVQGVTLTTTAQSVQNNGAYGTDVPYTLALVVSTAAPGAGGPAVGTPITTTINFTATAN